MYNKVTVAYKYFLAFSHNVTTVLLKQQHPPSPQTPPPKKKTENKPIRKPKFVILDNFKLDLILKTSCKFFFFWLKNIYLIHFPKSLFHHPPTQPPTPVSNPPPPNSSYSFQCQNVDVIKKTLIFQNNIISYNVRYAKYFILLGTHLKEFLI